MTHQFKQGDLAIWTRKGFKCEVEIQPNSSENDNFHDGLCPIYGPFGCRFVDTSELSPAPLQAEPVTPSLKVYKGDICYKSTADDQSYGMWCPVSYEYAHGLQDGTEFYTHPPAAQPVQASESVLIDGVAYDIPAPVAAQLLRLHIELHSTTQNLQGEAAVMRSILAEAESVLSTIEPEDDEEARRLAMLLLSIKEVLAPVTDSLFGE